MGKKICIINFLSSEWGNQVKAGSFASTDVVKGREGWRFGRYSISILSIDSE